MPAIILFFTLLAFGGFFLTNIERDRAVSIGAGNIDAISGNFLIYRNAVVDYVSSNPSATGVIADISLGLPTWYRKDPNISNYVSGGKSYVYYAGPDAAGLAGSLYDKTQSLSVGTNNGGVLYSPATGNTGQTLPWQVPAQAVVISQ